MKRVADHHRSSPLFVVGGAVAAVGAGDGAKGTTYKIVFDNAFGLVKGADFKVGGVAVGSIERPRRHRKDARAHGRGRRSTTGGDGFAGLRDDAHVHGQARSR